VGSVHLAHPAGGDPRDDLVATVDGCLEHHGNIRGAASGHPL
jgi:hypothetical protein